MSARVCPEWIPRALTLGALISFLREALRPKPGFPLPRKQLVQPWRRNGARAFARLNSHPRKRRASNSKSRSARAYVQQITTPGMRSMDKSSIPPISPPLMRLRIPRSNRS